MAIEDLIFGRIKLFTFFLLIFIGVGVISCNGNYPTEQRGEVLAQVGEKTLYTSDIEFLIQRATNESDSVQIIKSYVENWARDQALLIEAEKNLNNNPSIERKVEDYRSSLMRHNYTSQIVNEKLDTSLTRADIKRFYDNNSEQFVAPELFVKCRFIGIPSNQNNVWKIRNAIFDLEQSIEDLEELIRINEGQWIVEPGKWFYFSDIENILGESIARENIIEGFEFSLNEGENRIFLKVIEVVPAGDLLPFDLVTEKIRQLVLLERKKQLLNKIRNDLYEKEVRNNNIKINIQ